MARIIQMRPKATDVHALDATMVQKQEMDAPTTDRKEETSTNICPIDKTAGLKGNEPFCPVPSCPPASSMISAGLSRQVSDCRISS